MRVKKPDVLWAALGLLCLAGLALGWLRGAPLPGAAGAIGAVFVLWRLTQRATAPDPPARNGHAPAGAARPAADPDDLDAVVDQMLSLGRYALLLRPQIACKLDEDQFHRALEALENGMGLVPDGEVALGRVDEALSDGRLDDEEVRACRGRIIRVEHFFLDRYPVTHRQYYEFVAAGGYAQMDLWDPTIWAAVLDFVDRTGEPGPRFWVKGCYEPGLEDHPVVGVSWYEAAAYARWLGKRLPTDAEWVKAGSWPINLSATARLQRKYPWGDTADPGRANLWTSGRRGTVAVDELPGGMSVGGICQLVGNVWEWTRGDYRPDLPDATIVAESPIKSIRGGAFDTYFDNQATCHFPSGEAAVARKPNIGFRCAIGVCDLVLARPAPEDHGPAEDLDPCPQELQR
jgi:iron(II)-dependent oxidoreductase